MNSTTYKRPLRRRRIDGYIVLNEHDTVLGSKRLAICATVYVGVQKHKVVKVI